MKYNTQKEKLIMPEYGRSVQNMIQHAIQLPSKEERQRCAENIIAIMRDIAEGGASHVEQENRVWDHLAYIANYRLDIDYPCTITRLDKESTKPHSLKYPRHNIQHHQYGRLIEEGLRYLKDMEKGQERDALLFLLANQMKLNLFNWNKDAMSNEKIATDIAHYTQGNVQIDPEKFQWKSVVNLPKTDGIKKKKRKTTKEDYGIIHY